MFATTIAIQAKKLQTGDRQYRYAAWAGEARGSKSMLSWEWEGLFRAVHKGGFTHGCKVRLESNSLQWSWDSGAGISRSRSYSRDELIGCLLGEDNVILYTLRINPKPGSLKIYEFKKAKAGELTDLHRSISELLHPAVPAEPKTRRMLFIVNPYSGRRKGAAVFDLVRPLFGAAGIHPVAHTTARAGHARELVRLARLSDYDAVVAVGGDGTANEVVASARQNSAIQPGQAIIPEAVKSA